MTSKIVLDSSILVEYFKQNKTELLDHLIALGTVELMINSIVLSEAAYYWLARRGSKAPRSLQEAQLIPGILQQYNPTDFLSQFTVLPSDDRIVSLYLDLMQQYNLLPNDALIIATAKLHQIPAVASFDADFAGEGIRLVRDVADLA
ncbi:PIN domain-containing protein [Spirosoma rhododendri]|uniref:PIN domain-containing protein n=1 Tax=Spirosoma rhododendri TaxID=2728024 RepID=A0A7L5DMU2_9BACT|nr:PIN domain-containing protein [Spirosoma rhododendri]QJD77768.1 PIN domain-containing protein [Spirosoma rhododendri]